MTETPTLDEVVVHLATIVRPGDTVVLLVPSIDPAQVAWAREQWHKLVPDVEVVFTNASDIAVIRRSED